MKRRVAHFVFLSLVVSGFAISTSSGVSAISLPECGSSGTPTVNQMADTNFHVDFGESMNSNYAGYQITGDATNYPSVTTTLSSFTGGSIGLANAAVNSDDLGELLAAGSVTTYFLLSASGLSSSPQSHVLTLSTRGTGICEKSFSYTGVYDTIKAAANKVISAVTSSPRAPAKLGDVATVTVTGETGVLGAGPGYDPQMLSITPNTNSSFPTSSWRLERVELEISPDGVASPVTYIDDLFINSASGPNRPYTATYFYRANQSISTPTEVSPIQFIASGTQVKHTTIDPTKIASLPSISDAVEVSLAKSASPTSLLVAGEVTFTVRIANNDTSPITLDRIDDTIPASSSYKPSSTTLDATSFDDPVINGSTLTWWGPFTIAANSFKDLIYTLNFDGTEGLYVNAVVASVGQAQVDVNATLSSRVPATASVIIGDPAVLGATKVITSETDTDLSGDVTPGDIINYTITATNSGGSDATSVNINDPLTGDSKNCGTLAPAASCTLTTSYTILMADQGSTVTNTADVTATNATPTSATASVVVPAAVGSAAGPATSTGVQGATQRIMLPTADGNQTITTGEITVALDLNSPFGSSAVVPEVGTFTVNTDGTVTFVPVGTFIGTRTITYKVDDQVGGISTSTITVTVTPLTVGGSSEVVPAGSNGDIPLTGIPTGANVGFPASVANVSSMGFTNNRVTIVPTQGFSGIIRIPVTITTGSAILTTEVVLTVLPLAAPSVSWLNSAKTSTIAWPKSPTPTVVGYIVLLEGREVCRTSSTQRTCVVPGPLGRNAKVSITAIGGDETLSVVTLGTPPRAKCTELASVRFATNSAKLTAAAKSTLRGIAAQVNLGGFRNICTTGHTDSRGTVMANKYLSYKRVINVQNYLNKFVTSTKARLRFTYLGELRPVVADTSKNNMAQNRRVEVAIG